MKLGFVSAIFPDLSLGEVFDFAAAEGFACVEVMCWPPPRGEKADRRYAGVSHLDVTSLGEARVAEVLDLVARTGVAISALGYYPNPLDADPAHRHEVQAHLRRVIDAARSWAWRW